MAKFYPKTPTEARDKRVEATPKPQ
jgi:hypothetical protein